MQQRTIKISEENYKWLLKIAADVQKEMGRRVSFDDALNDIKEKKMEKKDIMNFAGTWKMSDKEWKEIKKSLKRNWEKWDISV